MVRSGHAKPTTPPPPAPVHPKARWLTPSVIALIGFGLGCAVQAAIFLHKERRASDAQAIREAERERMARAGITKLERALNMYKIHHGNYPEGLGELLAPLAHDRPCAIDSPAELIDPWQRPYVYEAKNRSPVNGVPRVHSAGADPSNPLRRISNW